MHQGFIGGPWIGRRTSASTTPPFDRYGMQWAELSYAPLHGKGARTDLPPPRAPTFGEHVNLEHVRRWDKLHCETCMSQARRFATERLKEK